MSNPTDSPVLRIVILPHGRGLERPRYETETAAGLDLRAAIDAPLPIAPGERLLVPSGLTIEIPHGFEGQIRPRSGLAFKYGITCLNSPGTIDSDYRGEVGILLVNHGAEPFTIERGMRVAQLVIAPVAAARIAFVGEISESGRGTGGFGSTGTQ